MAEPAIKTTDTAEIASSEAPRAAAGAALLQAARAQAEARRGERWAFPTIAGRKTAFVVLDLNEGEAGARSQPLATKVRWIGDALRASGGRVAWVSTTKEAATPVYEAVLGGDAAQLLRDREAPKPWGEAGACAADLQLKKSADSAFFPGACFMPSILRSYGYDTVILAGLRTDGAVESSARDAAAQGFRVIVAADACAASTGDEHFAALAAIHRNVGDVRDAQDIVTLLRASAR